jgi:aryl-alcohol dehydrogenase-like predicted oxidoreductase
MAIAWTLRSPEVATALIGASDIDHIEENAAALEKLNFGETSSGRSTQSSPARVGRTAAALTLLLRAPTVSVRDSFSSGLRTSGALTFL